MKNFFLTPLLFILAVSSQLVYAHDKNSDVENRDIARQEKSAQQDRDTWDDFMKAVKEQENKPTNSEAADTTVPTNSFPTSHNY